MTTTSPTGPSGPAGRVAAAHRQMRATLRVTLAFVVAAASAAMLGGALDVVGARWAALHLFLVGALLSAVSGATQYLAVTWSASAPASDSSARVQRWLLAAGAAALVALRQLDAPGWSVAVAGAAVAAALGVLVVLLVRIRANATVDRFTPALDAYLVAAGFGLGGTALGALLGWGVVEVDHLRLRDAHVAANLLGVLGITVAGTLPHMAATQARTKMSPRATPGAIWAVVTTMTAANVVAIWGVLAGDERLAATGLWVHALSVLAMCGLLPALGAKQFRWAGPRLVQLLSGIAWWVFGTVALGWQTFHGGDADGARLALVLGGFGQVLTASLAYLAPVLRGGGHRRLTAGFATTRSWVAPVAGNVAALAALLGTGVLLLVALAAWAVDLTVRLALLVRRGGDQ